MDTKLRTAADSGRALRPVLRARPFGSGHNKAIAQTLTEQQQTELERIATEVHFKRGVSVYAANSRAHSVFIVKKGMLKAFQDLSDGKQRVLAFLFAGDLFGLAEDGHYINSMQTIVPTACFKISIDALTDAFRRDSELELQFLLKTTHELREAQRQQITLTRREAHARFAMFLHMLQRRAGSDSLRIELAMSRSDIARYLGLSLEAVSRATARLSRDGIVEFQGRRAAKIINQSRFEQLALAV